MREIKFRAWDKVANDLHDWDFLRHLGLYITELFNDEDYILMQYTDLKDCKGREIYEGDILHLDNFLNWQVEWLNGGFVIRNISGVYDGKTYLLTEGSALQREIIGNIYQNPELLKR